MLPHPEAVRVAIAIALAAVVLRFTLWRALLCLKPTSVRLELEAPADQVTLPIELKGVDQELTALGFQRLGTRSEKPKFGKQVLSFDYANEADGTFATAYLEDAARVYFLTHTDTGGFVISANHKRPAKEVPGRYFSSCLEDVSVERLYRAHQRTMVGFGTPVGPYTQEGRLEKAKAWYEGPGRSELRLQHLPGLLWSVGSLGMVGAVFWGKP